MKKSGAEIPFNVKKTTEMQISKLVKRVRVKTGGGNGQKVLRENGPGHANSHGSQGERMGNCGCVVN